MFKFGDLRLPKPAIRKSALIIAAASVVALMGIGLSINLYLQKIELETRLGNTTRNLNQTQSELEGKKKELTNARIEFSTQIDELNNKLTTQVGAFSKQAATCLGLKQRLGMNEQ